MTAKQKQSSLFQRLSQPRKGRQQQQQAAAASTLEASNGNGDVEQAQRRRRPGGGGGDVAAAGADATAAAKQQQHGRPRWAGGVGGGSSRPRLRRRQSEKKQSKQQGQQQQSVVGRGMSKKKGGVVAAIGTCPTTNDSDNEGGVDALVSPSATESLSSASHQTPSPDRSRRQQQQQHQLSSSPDLPRQRADEVPVYVEEERDPAVQSALRHRYRCPVGNGSSASGSCCDCLAGAVDEEFQNCLTRAVTALDRSGNECFAAGDYEQAMLRYERALLLKRFELNATELAQAEGTGQQQQSSPAGAAPGQGETAEQRANIMASVATSINNMTYLKQRAGLATAEETMASYLKSLQMKRDILGPDHLSVGKTLNNIGSVFYLKKEYEPALSAYKDARRIMEENLGSGHLDVGTVISNIGDVYNATDQKNEALVHYRLALDVRWVKLGPQDPKVIRLMKQVASLETGQQPEKDENEVSESDHYLEGDQERDSVFMESVQNLSEELEEDMKYFDLLEREMAISMVKDKMRIFREMRELHYEEESEEEEDLLGDFAIPSRRYDENETTQPQTFDASDGSILNNSATRRFQEQIKATLDDSMFSLDLSETNADEREDAPAYGGKTVSEVSRPAEDARTKSRDEVPTSHIAEDPRSSQQKKEVESSATLQSAMGSSASALQRLQALSNSPCITPGSSRSPSRAGSGGSYRVPSRAGSGSSHRRSFVRKSPSPSPSLSAEERQEALTSVRDRLAKLRAERCQDGSMDAPLLVEVKKKSYMFPTASSSAKATTTTPVD